MKTKYVRHENTWEIVYSRAIIFETREIFVLGVGTALNEAGMSRTRREHQRDKAEMFVNDWNFWVTLR